MAESSGTPLTEDQITAAKAAILNSLSNDTIESLAKLLARDSAPQVTEHVSVIVPDKECAICNYTLGEQRDDGTLEIGITLPCNHSFGMRCLAQAVQRVETCPMCRGDIPSQVVKDLTIMLSHREQDHDFAHPGATCPHNADAFDEREYVQEDPNLLGETTSFDYEFALPHGLTGWTHLVCPNTVDNVRQGGNRAAHTDEIVVAIAADDCPLVIGDGTSDDAFCFALWYGPTHENARFSGANSVQQAKMANDRNGAVLEGALYAIQQYSLRMSNGVHERGGKLILKSSSDYFCRSITEYLDVWRGNGFKNLKGRPIRHKQLWRALSDSLILLRDVYGARVVVWEVDDDFMKPITTMVSTVQNALASENMQHGVTDKALRMTLSVWQKERDKYFRRNGHYGTPDWIRFRDGRRWTHDDSGWILDSEEPAPILSDSLPF